MTPLVIVDMQSHFSNSQCSKVIVGVAQEIEKAIKRNAWVIVVEWKGNGKTHAGLTDLLKGYRRKATAFKMMDDGSPQVMQELTKRRLKPQAVRVCGVNTLCCVRATVRGLLKKAAFRVEVARRACDRISQKGWMNYGLDYGLDVNENKLKLIPGIREEVA